MNTKPVGGAQAARNNVQNETIGLECKWSIEIAPPGTEVGILVHSDRDIHVTTAIINIYQWYDNRPHPVAAFKVPFTGKRDVNFAWPANGANGSDHEKGALYFAVSVGNHRATSNGLQLRGKAVVKPQPKPVDGWQDGKKKLMSLDGK